MTQETKWRGSFKLIEEMSELAQVLGKLAQCPDGDHFGRDLRPALQQELGDTLAAIEYFIAHGGLDRHEILIRAGDKLLKYDAWSQSEKIILKGLPVQAAENEEA